MHLKLIGADGVIRDLLTGDVRVAPEGVQGLFGAPAPVVRARQDATRAGQQRTSTVLRKRPGSITVYVNITGKQSELISVERGWASAWSYDQPATLEVATKGEQPRYLDLFFDGGDLDFVQNPDRRHVYEATVDVIADDPLWRGPLQTYDFASNEPDADFFGRDEVHGQEGAPDWWLSPAYLPIVKLLRNPGNVPAPVRWILTGPINGFDTIIDGRSVGGKFIIPEGQTLRIDSDANTALLDTGAEVIDMWRELTSWGFARLAPGRTSTVSIEREGTGSARLEWTPQYRQARG